MSWFQIAGLALGVTFASFLCLALVLWRMLRRERECFLLDYPNVRMGVDWSRMGEQGRSVSTTMKMPIRCREKKWE